MNKIIGKTLFLAFVGIFSACAPRGESQTLSDLLAQQRERYRAAELKFTDSPIKTQLTAVAQKMAEIEKVQDPNALKPATLDLKNSLSGLIAHAGYTARPALAELVGQYQAIANGSAVTTDPAAEGSPEVRLLLVRTYSLLATELETSKFSL